MIKKIKLIINLLVIAALIGVGIFIFNGGLARDKINREVQISLVQDNLIELAELATLHFDYKNVIISTSSKTLSLLGLTDIKYAEATQLIEYTGYLKAGTDFTDIEISYDEATDSLTADVPHARILDNVVQTEAVVVQDVKKNIFVRHETKIVFDEINENKAKLERDKVAQGFLDEADKRIASLLRSFLHQAGFDDVVVEFR
jgi:hypothetical protein